MFFIIPGILKPNTIISKIIMFDIINDFLFTKSLNVKLATKNKSLIYF